MSAVHPDEVTIARIAHGLWCERMRAQGWSAGPFNEVRKTHDALVPFEELGPVDRHSTLIGVVARELLDELRDLVDYSRGSTREFAASELSQGMRLGFDDDQDSLGTVVSWKVITDWPECVSTITVQWDSGELNEHAAAECELRRLDAGR